MGVFKDFSWARQADWLNGERLRVYAIMVLIGYAAAVIVMLVTADGVMDAKGRPLGTDFSGVYTAGRLVVQGAPEDAFAPQAHYAEQQAFFQKPDTPFYGWHYPPMLLFIAALLSLLPYSAALMTWVGGTFAFYAAALRAVWPHGRWLLLAAAAPTTFITALHGHNGFLTAALMGFGLLFIRTRPILAGVCFGLMTYKPHLGVLIPFALMAVGAWRVIFSAGVTTIAVAAAAFAAFGADTWAAFFRYAAYTQDIVLETGGAGWFKIQSVFSAARMWGAPLEAAYGVQALSALAAVAATLAVWRSQAAYGIKCAALCFAAPLASPYLFEYDLVFLTIGVAFFIKEAETEGFRPWEKITLAAVVAYPLFARMMGLVFIPLTPFIMAAALGICLRRTPELGFALQGLTPKRLQP
ncbi:MAG: glycosyltransferase family 87 protein [Pseudomonadota bacterium]